MRWMLLLLAGGLGMASGAGGATMEDLVERQYARRQLAGEISEDGRNVALVRLAKEGAEVFVHDLDAGRAAVRVQLARMPFVEDGRSQVWWGGATRLVVLLGDQFLVALNTDGSDVVHLVDWTKAEWKAFDGIRVVAPPDRETGSVIVEAYKRFDVGGATPERIVAKVELATGRSEVVFREPLSGHLYFDRQGKVRLWERSVAGGRTIDYRATTAKGERWVPLANVAGADAARWRRTDRYAAHEERSGPVGFAADPGVLYFTSNVGRDKRALFALNLDSGGPATLVLERPVFDLGDWPMGERRRLLVVDRWSGQLAGVRLEEPAASVHWFDAEVGRVQRRIAQLETRPGVAIEGWDRKRTRFLVRCGGGAGAANFAVYHPGENTMRHFPAVDDEESEVSPHVTPWMFRQANGAVLTGRLTLPAGPKAKSVPVVAVFGAFATQPIGASVPLEVIALARMGYAVLETNHRGVTGLGREHFAAARGRFDVAAVEDMLAALDRLAPAAGLDARTLAVHGGGYGGYFALRAAQLRADRIRCVTTLSPRTNPESWIPTWSESASSNIWVWLAGEAAGDLSRFSVLEHAAKLTCPLLVVDAAERESQRTEGTAELLQELKGLKRPAEVVKIGAVQPAERRLPTGFRAMEEFLARHLGASKP